MTNSKNWISALQFSDLDLFNWSNHWMEGVVVPQCQGSKGPMSPYGKIKFILKKNIQATQSKEISCFLTLPFAVKRGQDFTL